MPATRDSVNCIYIYIYIYVYSIYIYTVYISIYVYVPICCLFAYFAHISHSNFFLNLLLSRISFGINKVLFYLIVSFAVKTVNSVDILITSLQL